MTINILALIWLLALSCRSSNPVQTPDPDPPVKKKWTVLFYANADNWDGTRLLPFVSSNMRSGPLVNVVVLEDTPRLPASFYWVDEDQQPVLIEEKRELNLGDGSVLTDFLIEAKRMFPSERTLLCFYGLGHAWYGICMDYTNGYDILTPEEISNALRSTGGVNLVYHLSTPYTACIEYSYEFLGLAEALVSNQYGIDIELCSAALKRIDEILLTNPDIPIPVFAEEIVCAIRDQDFSQYSESWLNRFTTSAILIDRLEPLVLTLDEICLACLNDSVRFEILADSALHRFIRIGGSQMDLLSFSESLRAAETDPFMKQKLTLLSEQIRNAVPVETHGIWHPPLCGLSIYMPDTLQVAYDSNYHNYQTNKLMFVMQSYWESVLRKIFDGPLGETAHQPDPAQRNPATNHLFKNP